MGVLETVGVVGAAASILGLLLFVIRRGPKPKLLTWDSSPPVQIASVLPHRADYKLSILYERTGEDPRPLSGAFLRFVQLANLGDEPIRSDDLVPNDPLRLEISETDVLDVSLAAVTRDVTNFQLGDLALDGDQATSGITFDFLDNKDGALIRVLTADFGARINIRGTVIGMPRGFPRMGEASGAWPCGVTVLLLVLLYALALAGTVVVFARFADDSNLLLQPFVSIAAILGPYIIAILLGALIFPSKNWPDRIRIPDWAQISITRH